MSVVEWVAIGWGAALLTALCVIPGHRFQPVGEYDWRPAFPCRWWRHRWREVEDTGIHRYERCERCGARRITGGNGRLSQPVDVTWLRTGAWQVITPPRPQVWKPIEPLDGRDEE